MRRCAKDSFLRALREVAPEMELFLENHWQYMKNFAILQKNCILKNMSEKTFRHIFLRKTSPKHYFRRIQKRKIGLNPDDDGLL